MDFKAKKDQKWYNATMKNEAREQHLLQPDTRSLSERHKAGFLLVDAFFLTFFAAAPLAVLINYAFSIDPNLPTLKNTLETPSPSPIPTPENKSNFKTHDGENIQVIFPK